MPLLVINHHYVRPERYLSGIYPTSPEQLQRNVEILLRSGWHPVALEEILQWPDRIFKQNSFLITFDDGLKCSFRYGEPVLKQLGIQAVFFISTSVLQGKALFVHKLHFVRSQIPDTQLTEIVEEVLGEPVRVNEVEAQKQYRYDEAAARKIKYFFNFSVARQPQLRDEIIRHIMLNYLRMSEEEFHQQWYMTPEEIQTLRRSGHSIGSHGHMHVPLAQLSEDQIRLELQQAQTFLKDLLGEIPVSISYPYGGPTAVSPQVYQVARELGLRIGFTMQRDLNFWKDWISDPLALKRIDVKDLLKWI